MKNKTFLNITIILLICAMICVALSMYFSMEISGLRIENKRLIEELDKYEKIGKIKFTYKKCAHMLENQAKETSHQFVECYFSLFYIEAQLKACNKFVEQNCTNCY